MNEPLSNSQGNTTMSEQEIHEFGIDIVRKYAEEKGYEILNGTTDIDLSPQLVIGKENELYFVIIKTTASSGTYKTYDNSIMRMIKENAVNHNAKVLYAGVGIRSMTHGDHLVKNSPFMVNFKGFEEM